MSRQIFSTKRNASTSADASLPWETHDTNNQVIPGNDLNGFAESIVLATQQLATSPQQAADIKQIADLVPAIQSLNLGSTFVHSNLGRLNFDELRHLVVSKLKAISVNPFKKFPLNIETLRFFLQYAIQDTHLWDPDQIGNRDGLAFDETSARQKLVATARGAKHLLGL
jgi:hypothetical protein